MVNLPSVVSTHNLKGIYNSEPEHNQPQVYLSTIWKEYTTHGRVFLLILEVYLPIIWKVYTTNDYVMDSITALTIWSF